jgi:hypothetical protein
MVVTLLSELLRIHNKTNIDKSRTGCAAYLLSERHWTESFPAYRYRRRWETFLSAKLSTQQQVMRTYEVSDTDWNLELAVTYYFGVLNQKLSRLSD